MYNCYSSNVIIVKAVETEEIHYATTTFCARHLPNTVRYNVAVCVVSL